MKTIALLFAICSPATMPAEKPPCRPCFGTGLRGCFASVIEGHWLKLPSFKRCDECDGYGREVTLYGRLLKGAR